jgi:pimeloyl-ACP methyl ester carboxylesterase
MAMFAFTKFARRRSRRAPDTLAGVREFAARRTALEAQAATNNPRPAARETTSPVHYLSGLIDPIVPWLFVQHWLKCHCPALRECKINPAADHHVLGTAPEKSAGQVLQWMES